jgi:hypothetical protein
MRPSRLLRPALAAAALAAVALAPHHRAAAFSQAYFEVAPAAGIPLGHEWITRLAALELVGGETLATEGNDDPRRAWPADARARSISLHGAEAEVAKFRADKSSDSRFRATYGRIFAAIVGERWVDIGGFNVVKSSLPLEPDCFDAVAQDPVSLQYDHYLRRPDDAGDDGAVRALRGSRDRFVQSFVVAASAPAGHIKVFDGGGYSAAVEVDRNYFLFGRPLHTLQDSFSPEHAVRTQDDHFRKLRQVKSYLCSQNSEQHTHQKPWTWAPHYHGDRDAIWTTKVGLKWSEYKTGNMTAPALAAIEASKDAWAAFIRVMALPQAQRAAAARQAADAVANAWLAFDEPEVRGWYGQAGHRDATYVADAAGLDACVKLLGIKSGKLADKLAKTTETQRKCLYNVEAKDAAHFPDHDPNLHVPYYWKWKGLLWKKVPANWTLPSEGPGAH